MWVRKALTHITQGLSCWTCNQKGQKSALETAPSKLESKKAAEDAAAEEDSKCLAEEAAWKGGKSDEGHQQDM